MKCYSKKQAVVDSLYTSFKCHGVPKNVVADVIEIGLKAGLSLEQSEAGARMAIPGHYGFHEYFTIKDVAAVTGETEETVKKRADKLRHDLIKQGKDPREYFPEVSFAPGYGGVQ